MRIRAIYAVDREIRRASASTRATLRDERLRPLIDEFFVCGPLRAVDRCRAQPRTKALGYAANQETELRRVLDDPDLSLDNTRAERALRKIVVGRKNWLFYGSDAHAEALARHARSAAT